MCGQNPFRFLLGKSLVLIWIYSEDFCGMEEKLNKSNEIPSEGTSFMIERERFLSLFNKISIERNLFCSIL